jgi:hypothetical protein
MAFIGKRLDEQLAMHSDLTSVRVAASNSELFAVLSDLFKLLQ